MAKIKHQPVDWNTNHDRIMLYADIMGFKTLLKDTPHEKLVSKLRTFVDTLRRRISPFQTAGHLRMTLFSDLVVMAADRCTVKNFILICKAAAELMRECHMQEFPINGCISCGPLAFDDSNQIFASEAAKKLPYMPLFVGQSVVDAYLLNEDLFCYGIVLHPNAENLFNQVLERTAETGVPSPAFTLLNIPLKKGGFSPLYYYNWTETKLADNDIKINDVKQWNETVAKSMSTRTRAYAFNTLNLIKTFQK